MKRQLIFTLTDGGKVSPSVRQWGGMQFEDSASEIIFDISDCALPIEEFSWRIDMNSPTAGYSAGSLSEVADGKITRDIPYDMTKLGGEIEVTLVATRINKDFGEEGVCISFPVQVYFTEVERSGEAQGELSPRLSGIEASVKDAAEQVFEAEKRLADNYDRLESIYTTAEAIDRSLEEIKENGRVYIGEGEMPEWANLQIDPTGETLDFETVYAELERRVGSSFSNVLKRNLCDPSCVAVDMTDISPTNKALSVKLSPKNLIPASFVTETVGGVTFRVLEDGRVGLLGTAEENIKYYLAKGLRIPAYTYYTLSGHAQGSWWGKHFLKLEATDGSFIAEAVDSDLESSNTFISHREVEVDIWIQVGRGTVCDGATFSPQLEKGKIKTAYTPPKRELGSLIKRSKNLHSGEYLEGYSIQTSGQMLLASDPQMKLYYIKAAPNTTYTMHRAGGIGNCVFVTAKELPTADNVPITYQKQHGTAGDVQFQITTDADTRYICYQGETWKCQIEVGEVKSDYEPYSPPEVFTPDGAGNIAQITGIGYNTQLETDEEGVLLECVYCRDINKAFEELSI